MNAFTELAELLHRDPLRLAALKAVRSLNLRDCWIAAGFVRDAVWDHLHGRPLQPPCGDVDVIWFDGMSAADEDLKHEDILREIMPEIDWSVKNQAWMHIGNGDGPYGSTAEAMSAWPETATAVAVRLTSADRIEINAPLGLGDLFGLRLIPTANFRTRKRVVVDSRMASKRWLERYPLLQLHPQ